MKLDDVRESAFLIQDMFPFTEEYIEQEYTIAGNHLLLTSEYVARTIEQKAKKVMDMLKCGVKFTLTQPDVMKIFAKLKQENVDNIKRIKHKCVPKTTRMISSAPEFE